MWPYAPVNEFSEDGRLNQVEYATKATQLSSTIVSHISLLISYINSSDWYCRKELCCYCFNEEGGKPSSRQ